MSSPVSAIPAMGLLRSVLRANMIATGQWSAPQLQARKTNGGIRGGKGVAPPSRAGVRK